MSIRHRDGTHIFHLEEDNGERNTVQIRRPLSTPELRSLDCAFPAVGVVSGTPVVEAVPVEIDYFCCCCSRVKEPPLFSL